MDKTENQAVIDLAAGIHEYQRVEGDGKPYQVLPPGYTVVDLENTMDRPVRKRGTAKFNDAASFVDYFKIHSDNGCIYGQVDPPLFVAVLNDNATDFAGWADHRATYQCPLSREWKIWKQAAGQPRDQLAFAEFIETNTPDIISTAPGEPSGAEMLEIATSFKAQKKVNFSSGQRLDNGQVDFTYQEDIQGSAGAKGHIKVPERFFIAVPVFEGGAPYKVEAKLRYRLKDGNLTMWFDLVRDHKVLEAAFMDVWKEIADGTGTTIWRGTPA